MLKNILFLSLSLIFLSMHSAFPMFDEQELASSKIGRVRKKVALVTGGASGIGEATCIEFAKEGAAVAIVDINESGGNSVAQRITSFGGTAIFYNTNIVDEDAVKRTIQEIVTTWGKLDILVNNAGIPGVNKPTHEVTVDEWDRGLNLNTKGVFLCTKHSIPFMIQQNGGSIVNVSSIFGIIGGGNAAPYHAAKGAILAMTKNDAASYGKFGIRVNAICPSSVRTPMTNEYAREYPGGIGKFYEDVGPLHPLGRVANPAEIAKTILFLASDEASFVTGGELLVDGGITSCLHPQEKK